MRIGRASAELLIIVVGVIIGLAADGWRQDQRDRALEGQYLERLRADLTDGLDALSSLRTRFGSAWSASLEAATLLDAGPPPADEDHLLEAFLTASETGFSPQMLGPDATYLELVASGQLALLTDPALRTRIVRYYDQFDRLSQLLDRHENLNRIVGEVTGRMPREFESADDLSPEERDDLLRELRERPDALRMVRLQRADLTVTMSSLNRAYSDLESLVTLFN